MTVPPRRSYRVAIESGRRAASTSLATSTSGARPALPVERFHPTGPPSAFGGRRAASTSIATSTLGARPALPVERFLPDRPAVRLRRTAGPGGSPLGRPPPPLGTP